MNVAPSLAWLATALLFLAPAVNLIVRGGSGYCFFALFAVSLGAAIAYRKVPHYFCALRTYGWYTLGMTALMVAILIQQAVLSFWIPRQFDAISRFPLVLPVFLLLRQLSSRQLRAIGWGCAAGAIIVGVHGALFMHSQTVWTDADRLNNTYTNAIPFGDTALLLGFLSAFTLGWDTPRDWRVLAVKLFAFACGVYASYLSGTRGGWLAIPVFIVLLGFQYGWFAHKKRTFIAVIAVIIGVAVALSNERVAHRIDAAMTDLTQMQQGNEDTSVGLRLQLWAASAKLFAQHPVYGVGKGRLVFALDDMARHGQANAQIVNERAHSDFFSTLAEMGAIGVACLLLLYYGLTVYFWRHARSADATIRTAAYSGLAVSTSTIIFGLTIDVLVPIMVIVLVALLSAVFLAVIDARQRELGSTTTP
ncbi:MAG TPA: O-antigen ligase family protein [Pararobbsia sp.]|nr:O-antigen ligase family protein [Pararobbsia sp.]